MYKRYFLELYNPKTKAYHTQGEYDSFEEAEEARKNYVNPNYPNGVELNINVLTYDNEDFLQDVETY